MAASQSGDGIAPFQFSDGKDPGALRTIGEVSEALGIRQHVLRYWEEQFPMLKPVKRSGGRRYYRPQDVQLIAEIDRLVHREGYTLKGASKALASESPVIPAGGSARPSEESAPADPEFIFNSIQKIRDQLAHALADS